MRMWVGAERSERVRGGEDWICSEFCSDLWLQYFKLPLFIVWLLYKAGQVWYPFLILTDQEGSSSFGLDIPRVLRNPSVKWVGGPGAGKQSLVLLICIPFPHCNDKSRMKISKVSLWTMTAELQGFKVLCKQHFCMLMFLQLKHPNDFSKLLPHYAG